MSSRPPAARRPITTSADEPPTQSPPAVSNQPNSVMLGPRDRVIGQIYIEGDLRVGGVVEGEVEVTGDVEIDDMAKVKASLAGRDVTIRGHVNGAVVARKRLVVAKSGSLFGDVRVARLAIQDGATFSGKVSMGAGAATAPAVKVVEAPTPLLEPEPKLATEVEKPAAPIVAAPIVAAPKITPPAIIKTAAPAPVAELRVAGKDGKGRPGAAPIKGKPDKNKKKRR
ncbi:MAG TPA: polymer-forming cytoskeletal protein [Candidatus Eisenbacteria bacterium]|nr:polymer-forming cytoskeletal protein [Candidatus Eisenbacteria bacterium]